MRVSSKGALQVVVLLMYTDASVFSASGHASSLLLILPSFHRFVCSFMPVVLLTTMSFAKDWLHDVMLGTR
jgi:hypothetical protein